MCRLMMPVLAAMVALAMPVAAAETVSDFDRFRLWNGCAPIYLLVEGLDDDAKSIGLSKEKIKTVVHSRFRSARLYSSDVGNSVLYVQVTVVGRSFSIDFKFMKRLLDKSINLSNYATSWDTATTGTHGKSSDYIVSAVSEGADHFLDEFLRVNDAACRKSN